MDPLTLTTGILALLKASASLSGTLAKLRRLKDAPDLVQALNNEISDLRLILIHISDHHEDARNERLSLTNNKNPISDLCSSTLNQTRGKVQEVEALIKTKLLKSPGCSDSKINRIAFLRERDHLLQLQADLRIGRQRIANLFGQLGIKNISRIEVLLNDIRSNDLSMLLQSQVRIEDAIDRIEEKQLTPFNSARCPLQPARLPGSDNAGSRIVEVSISPVTANIPRVECTCRRRSASIKLHNLFGSLFLGYVATFSASKYKNSCSHYGSLEMRLVYVFPQWFLKYAFAMQGAFNGRGTIMYSLSVAQIISDDHIVWDLIDLGNLNGVKRLLNDGQLSIRAQNTCNQSLVEKVAWDQILRGLRSPSWRDEMRSLFKDPDLEELYSFNHLHQVILGLSSHSIKSILCAEPTLIGKMDSSGRTALSWAAWRADGETLEILLSYGADPNKADHHGKTPFSYAAGSDVECTGRLLEAGAAVNTKSVKGATSLKLASESGALAMKGCRLQMLELLIQAGAEVNAKTITGETALMASQCNDNATAAELLMQNGADPSICDNWGDNSLCRATRRNHHSTIALLIREHQDHTGTLENEGMCTFMHLAASYADAKSLRILAQGTLQRRNINVKNRTGLTPCQVGLQRENTDAEWKHAFFDFLRSLDQDAPFQPECVSESQEVHDEVARSDRYSTRSSAAGGEHDDSDQDFEDAVEVQE
ncbi:MAG: hypothetical protein Q9160_008892 [Pyrenula sp. 1 TL-2023]